MRVVPAGVPPGSENRTVGTDRNPRDATGGHVYDWTATQPVPPRRRGRVALIVVAAVVGVCCVAGGTAAVLGGILAGDGDGGGGTRALGGDAANPTGPGLNQPVRDGQFEFVVAAVRCGRSTLDHGLLHAEAKGQYCVAELRVTNIGTEARRFADGLQQAIGADGVRYAADTPAGVVANGNGEAIWEVINPGISIDTKVVYDIPDGASIVSLELHDAALSRGTTVHVAP